ncbi:MAG: universal stress protein [bacterium]
MKRFFRKFETMMSAITFAQEGEFEIAKEMLKEDRRVLLAIREGKTDQKVLTYALNTCQRIGASLDILYVSSRDTVASSINDLYSHLKEAGINYNLVKKSGDFKQEVIDWTNLNQDVVFVVIGDNLDFESKDKWLPESWNKIRCPMIVANEIIALINRNLTQIWL